MVIEMSYMHTTSYQILAAISIVFTMVSSFAQVPPESTLPSASACPSPAIETKAWQIVTLGDCGIRLKLPKKYKEHKWEVIVNNAVGHSYRAGSSDRIDIDVERPPNANPAQNKTIRQKDYEGFTECSEMIGGREAILQSFRGGGIIISADRQFRMYHAEGLWQLRSDQLLRISGDVVSRESQEEVLAVLRTVQFL